MSVHVQPLNYPEGKLSHIGDALLEDYLEECLYEEDAIAIMLPDESGALIVWPDETMAFTLNYPMCIHCQMTAAPDNHTEDGIGKDEKGNPTCVTCAGA